MTEQPTPNEFYQMGRKDTLSFLFLELRDRPQDEVLLDFAEQLMSLTKDDPNQNARVFIRKYG